MTENPAVLVGLSGRDPRREELRRRFEGWVQRLGYEPAVSIGGRETLARVRERERVFAATLLDCRMGEETGEEVWRTVRPILGRRLVLMAREPRNDIWFEALRAGVAALLPLPPQESMVRAALCAATRAVPSGGHPRAAWTEEPRPRGVGWRRESTLEGTSPW